jgi:hypothetical protein
MIKLKFLAGIFLLVFIVGSFGCNKNDEDDDVFLVEVISEETSCGGAILIQFEEVDDNKVRKYHENPNAFYPVFYASNMREEHIKTGLFLNIKLENCRAIDIPGCYAMGPGYAHVCIKSSETISLTFP